MFMRLMAIMHQEGYVEDHFRHEMTPEPSALFKDGLMRKPNKVALRNYILDKVKPEEGNTSWGCCVVDGGMLLHKMKWVVDSTFSDVLSSYVDYVEQRYQQFSTVCIVFDGYFDKNSREMSMQEGVHVWFESVQSK